MKLLNWNDISKVIVEGPKNNYYKVFLQPSELGTFFDVLFYN